LADLDLAWYDAGSGAPVVFLHGGPGLDHRYLRPLAALLAPSFHCVRYDQRGDGQSRLDRLTTHTLHPDRFIEDLEAFRSCLGSDRIRLLGHSGGALLALHYAARYPERTERLALLGCGPLDSEMSAVYRANVLRPLSLTERQEYANLGRRCRDALAAGDAAAYRAASARPLELHSRCWFYSPAAAAHHVPELLQLMGDPYLAAVLGQHGGDAGDEAMWKHVGQITSPVLIVCGYQDHEPITQAYHLKDHLPQARLCFLNECGHWHWLEQPDVLRQALCTFLR
jgi:proline iminopeptidase